MKITITAKKMQIPQKLASDRGSAASGGVRGLWRSPASKEMAGRQASVCGGDGGSAGGADYVPDRA